MIRKKYKTLLVVLAGILLSFAFNANAFADFNREKPSKFSDPFTQGNSDSQGGLRADGSTFNPNDEGAEEVGRRSGPIGDSMGLILGMGLIYGIYAGKRQRAARKNQ
jgi:hypothetical protein